VCVELGDVALRQWQLAALGEDPLVKAVAVGVRRRVSPPRADLAASRKRYSGQSISVRSPRWARSSSWSASRAPIFVFPASGGVAVEAAEAPAGYPQAVPGRHGDRAMLAEPHQPRSSNVRRARSERELDSRTGTALTQEYGLGGARRRSGAVRCRSRWAVAHGLRIWCRRGGGSSGTSRSSPSTSTASGLCDGASP
jgi:hypothetical protein